MSTVFGTSLVRLECVLRLVSGTSSGFCHNIIMKWDVQVVAYALVVAAAAVVVAVAAAATAAGVIEVVVVVRCTVSQTQDTNTPPSHIILTPGRTVQGLSSECLSAFPSLAPLVWRGRGSNPRLSGYKANGPTTRAPHPVE